MLSGESELALLTLPSDHIHVQAILVFIFFVIPAICFATDGSTGSGERIVVLSATEQSLKGSALWGGELPDCYGHPRNTQIGGDLKTISLDLTFLLDSQKVSGTVSGQGSSESTNTRNTWSFTGTITGKLNLTYSSGARWSWKMNASADISIEFIHSKRCFNPDTGQHYWTQETRTVAGKTLVFGRAGSYESTSIGGLGWFDIHFQQDNTYLRLSAKDDDTGRPIIKADFPPTIDITTKITGPAQIDPETGQAVFNIQTTGRDIDMIEEIYWWVSYIDPAWEAQYGNPGDWFFIEGQYQEPVNSLTFDAQTLDKWRRTSRNTGIKRGGVSTLQTKIFVTLYASQRRELILEDLSIYSSANHSFTTIAKLGADIPLNIYPTQANHTRVKVNGTGTDPINIATEHNPPPHIILTYNQIIQPQSGRYPELEIKAELDPSQTPGLQLPSEINIVFITRSGNQEEYFTLKLSLKKAEWLVMIYMAHETAPSVQRHLEGNLIEICNVSRRMDDPRVGIMVLTDMEFQINLDPGRYGINGLPPNNAQLYQIIKGNLTQVGLDWGSVRMNTQVILQRFITDSITRIPSVHKHLIISGHGHGVKGIAPDRSNRNIGMPMSILDRALTNQVFDVISFEACVMAQLEALNEIREHTTFFVASERTIPAGLAQGIISKTMISGGLAWREPLENLFSRSSMSPRDYAVSWVRSYGDKYSEGGAFRTSATLSAIEARNLPPLVASLDSLATAIVARYGAHNKLFNETLANVVKRTWEANHVPYTDIKNFAQNIVNDPNQVLRGLVEPARAVITAFDNAIIANTEIIIKHPKSALFLDWVGADAAVDYLTRINSGYSGMTIMLWREGVTGMPGAIYRSYLSWFDSTEYRTKAWRGFIQEFVRSHPTSATTINLHHPLHELYLHVYDSQGHHVGINPAESHGSDRLDMEIPGSLYIDYLNGTEVVLLPTNITDLVIVVDGMSMEEEVEEYTLTYELVLNDEITHREEVSGTIHEDSNHSMTLSTEGSKLSIGEVNKTKGTNETNGGEEENDLDEGNGVKKLPDWFTDGFPFLMPLVEPVVEPLLPYTPDMLIPLLPIIVLGLPLLIVVVITVRVMQKRKKDE